MDKDIAISVENVTMSFILNKEKVDNLKEYAIKLITGKLEYNKFDALKDINFKVKKGEHLAIMGLNGAGKSQQERKECRPYRYQHYCPDECVFLSGGKGYCLQEQTGRQLSLRQDALILNLCRSL